MIMLEAAARDDGRRVLKQDAASAWNPARFSIRRLPSLIGTVMDRNAFDVRLLPSCLDMPIKLPDGDVVVPAPYSRHSGIVEILEQCLCFEDSLLPGWRQTHYVYLTVDCRMVPEGRTHRNAGWHFDGMQGERYPRKLPACHQYLFSDRLPTEFAAGPFDALGLHETRHNWFVELGRQADSCPERFQPSPFDIVAMSAYQIHRAVPAGTGEAGWRTFVRVDVSVKQQDRLGNTPNPDLCIPFPYVHRSLPAGLQRDIADAGWDTGGVPFSSEERK